jgi:hypothetical protein
MEKPLKVNLHEKRDFTLSELSPASFRRFHPALLSIKQQFRLAGLPDELGEFAFLLLQKKNPAGSLKRRKHQHDGAGEENQQHLQPSQHEPADPS